MTKQAKEGKKKMQIVIICFIIGIIIGAAVVVISSIANKNVIAMNDCIDSALAEIKKEYTVTPVDVGEYEGLTIYGIMKFDVEQYDIKDIGNLSIMRMNMGLMQMSTFVLTPLDKNLPLFSADYMYILNNRKAYLEFYDLVPEKDDAYNQVLNKLLAVKDNYTNLEDFTASEAWYMPLLTVESYKSATSNEDAALKNIFMDYTTAYFEAAKELPVLTDEEKAVKLSLTVDYTNGLVEKGGVSTDVFKKELGEEKTKHFFDNVFFGTAK